MEEKLAVTYQRDLIYASLDDLNPAASLTEVVGGQCEDEIRERWRADVIDFLCRSLRGGLIKFPDYPDLSQSGGEERLRGLLEDIHDNLSVYWYKLYFEGTSELRVALESFGLLSWEAWNGGAHPGFIQWMLSRMRG